MSTGLTNIPMMIALAVMLRKLGGEVEISQADIDANVFDVVLEGFKGQNLILKLVNRQEYETMRDKLPSLKRAT